MGDRANIVVQDHNHSPVFLYSHWGGYEMPQTLQAALTRGRERWGQTPYLTRIIFCEMIRGDEASLTGYGISTDITDNDRPILVLTDAVGPVQGIVELCPEDRDHARGFGDPIASWSYSQFCEIDFDSIPQEGSYAGCPYEYLARLAVPPRRARNQSEAERRQSEISDATAIQNAVDFLMANCLKPELALRLGHHHTWDDDYSSQDAIMRKFPKREIAEKLVALGDAVS